MRVQPELTVFAIIATGRRHKRCRRSRRRCLVGGMLIGPRRGRCEALQQLLLSAALLLALDGGQRDGRTGIGAHRLGGSGGGGTRPIGARRGGREGDGGGGGCGGDGRTACRLIGGVDLRQRRQTGQIAGGDFGHIVVGVVFAVVRVLGGIGGVHAGTVLGQTRHVGQRVATLVLVLLLVVVVVLLAVLLLLVVRLMLALVVRRRCARFASVVAAGSGAVRMVRRRCLRRAAAFVRGRRRGARAGGSGTAAAGRGHDAIHAVGYDH